MQGHEVRTHRARDPVLFGPEPVERVEVRQLVRLFYDRGGADRHAHPVLAFDTFQPIPFGNQDRWPLALLDQDRLTGVVEPEIEPQPRLTCRQHNGGHDQRQTEQPDRKENPHRSENAHVCPYPLFCDLAAKWRAAKPPETGGHTPRTGGLPKWNPHPHLKPVISGGVYQ